MPSKAKKKTAQAIEYNVEVTAVISELSMAREVITVDAVSDDDAIEKAGQHLHKLATQSPYTSIQPVNVKIITTEEEDDKAA